MVSFDHQLSQLNQLLGQQRFGPAEAVLRQFIPRMVGSATCAESRAAAIWALGWIREGKPDPALTTALAERLTDDRILPPGPEDTRVRRMAALALGRMKAKEALRSLRRYCPVQEPSDSTIRNACGWAIEQITGAVMAPPKLIHKVQRDSFLTPLE